MSKQSSVQWLFQQLWDTPKDKLDWQSIFLMAHQMHQEEIEEAYGHGQNNGYMYAHQKAITISKENYFNQTFGDEGVL